MIAFTVSFLALIIMPGMTSNFLVNKLFACSALLCVLYRGGQKIAHCAPHYIFAGWLLWVFVGCTISDNNIMASTGYWGRNEGFLTWFLLSALAYAYWSTSEIDKKHILSKYLLNFKGFDLLFWLVLLVFISLVIVAYFVWPFNSMAYTLHVMPENALAGFASIGFVLLYAYHPLAVIPAVTLVLTTQNRTALLVMLVGFTCYHLLTSFKKSLKALVIAALLVCTLLPFTNVFKRIETLQPSTMGEGSRSQWILQGSQLASYGPVMGYGLDTLSQYLEPAKGKYVHKDAIADRTHFLPMDLVLQTGWLGYFISLALLVGCIHVVLQNRTQQNIICLSLIISWIAFNCINPSGVYGHLLMLIGLLGIRRDK